MTPEEIARLVQGLSRRSIALDLLMGFACFEDLVAHVRLLYEQTDRHGVFALADTLLPEDRLREFHDHYAWFLQWRQSIGRPVELDPDERAYGMRLACPWPTLETALWKRYRE